ncbi:MAG: helix-turn-helix transcriptional regulator [Carboxylicivirga sp.]|nr:helix-turn-helix transcriptional regulator [Carboxylicivirga sp.]
MKNIVKKLEGKLLAESLHLDKSASKELKACLLQVQDFVNVDGSLSVLSDLNQNTSYIFVGTFGHFLGMDTPNTLSVDSIWEDDIYQRIHPDDLLDRHLLELEFYNFLKQQAAEERLNFETNCKIRALNVNGEYHYIKHRTTFLRMDKKGELWLSLCIYEYTFDTLPQVGIEGIIVNKVTGECKKVNSFEHCSMLLTSREHDVLLQVSKGLLSKEIASRLKISLNTVNRHRQNILEKLKVNNSIEAVRVANALGLLK